MIPIIGIMIGCYILTRCSDIFEKDGAGIGTRILCAITALVAIGGIIALIFSGVSVANALKGY